MSNLCDTNRGLLDPILSRRTFLQRMGMGIGALGLSSMLTDEVLAGKTHVPSKVKSIIHIFAEGGPSQVDTFDPKPELTKYAEKTLPGMDGIAYPSPFKFTKSGKSGLEISDVFPKLQEQADSLCVIRSMWTDIPAHEVAQRYIHTGSIQLPKPSMGSWVLYGLGSGNENLPGFISIGGKAEWRQSSFLPGIYQGMSVNFSQNSPPEEVLQNLYSQFTTRDVQRRQLDLSAKLNKIHLQQFKDPQLEARISSFEMAFAMQAEATDAFDIKKESDDTRNTYGKTELGARLLVARRLVERGVRFIQVSAGGWDHHADLAVNLARKAAEIDTPAAALLADLKQKGLLDSTLVIWGGEFGRTVVKDRNGNATAGRDHNARAFSMWMAGGGTNGGTAYGSTDEFGAKAVENKVHVHDLHATIMKLLGFDHEKLTYRYNGRDFRLTDVYGKVITNLIA